MSTHDWPLWVVVLGTIVSVLVLWGLMVLGALAVLDAVRRDEDS